MLQNCRAASHAVRVHGHALSGDPLQNSAPQLRKPAPDLRQQQQQVQA